MATEKYDTLIAVDCHPVLLQGLEIILTPLFNNVYTSTKVETGLKLAIEKKPDMVILGYHFDLSNGSFLCKQIKERLPKAKVLAFTYDQDDNIIRRFFDAGVNGFILKSSSQKELFHSIECIMNGRDYFCHEVRLYLLNRFGFADSVEHVSVGGVEFSKNELKTMQLLCQQLSSKEISEQLFVSTKTVEFYRSNIIRKTAAKNIAGIIKFALKTGAVKLNQM